MTSKKDIEKYIKNIINSFRAHYNFENQNIDKLTYDSKIADNIFNWYKNSSPYANSININRFDTKNISHGFIINNLKFNIEVTQDTELNNKKMQGVIGIVDSNGNISAYTEYGKSLTMNKVYYYTSKFDMLDYIGIGYLGGKPEPIKDAIVIKKKDSNINISDESVIRNIPASVKYEFIEE